MGKADLLKKNVGKTSKGLFKGMEKLDAKDKNENIDKEVIEKADKEETTSIDKPTETEEASTEELPVNEVIEEKKVEPEPEESVETAKENNELKHNEEPAQPAVQQPVKQNVMPQQSAINEPQVYAQPQQYNSIPVQQTVQPQYNQMPVQPQVQQYQQMNNANMYAQQMQPNMMQQPVYMQPNVPQEYNEPKTTRRASNKSQEKGSRYEKDKFLLLDIRGLRDYVEHMAKASNLSATKYIRNLIEQDMNRNMDIYLRHKELEEQLKQRR